MKVLLNEKELTLFNGATLTHALQMYSKTALNDVKQGKAEVLDAYGNVTALDGALQNGTRLFLRTK